MMFWWGDQMSGWGWALMTINTIVFWALLIAGIIALIHYTRTAGTEHRTEPSTRVTPEQLLAERFARGEIDDPEYKRRLTALETTSLQNRQAGVR